MKISLRPESFFRARWLSLDAAKLLSPGAARWHSLGAASWRSMVRALILAFLAGLSGAGCSDDDATGPPRVPPGSRPATIHDLRWLGADSTSVRLAWTAPGADSLTGTAARYDVRMARGDTTRWEMMTALPLAPAPRAAGSAETLTVRGLQPDSTYAFRLRTANADSNWSAPSNQVTGMTAEHDVTPPGRPSIAFAGATDTSVVLRWTAPGDDGLHGQASRYEFWIHALLTDVSWTVDGPLPQPAGTVETFALGELSADQDYWVSLRAEDDAGLWSPESERISVRTGTAEDRFWWDGFAPAPAGAGLPDVVSSLLVYDGYLVAGLAPRNGGRQLVRRYDGTAWDVIGDGQLVGEVSRIAVYRGELIAAGHFFFVDGTSSRHIARWDGSRWRSLGAGLNGPVTGLLVYHDELIVAGRFYEAGGMDARGCARWNGLSWSAMDVPGIAWYAYPSSLGLSEDHLLLGTGDGLLERDSTRWQPIASVGVPDCLANEFSGLATIRDWNGSLFVGGRYGTDIQILGLVEGGTIQDMSPPPSPHQPACTRAIGVLAEIGGRLLAGGQFQASSAPLSFNLASWDGTTLRGFGSGLYAFVETGFPTGRVRAIAEYQGHMYVGGEFEYAGGHPSRNIARWDK